MSEPLATAWLNGRFLPLEEAKLSPLDRGFLFADGVYEVVPVYDGRPFLMQEHLERLDYSLSGIRLPNPRSREEWREVLEELAARNGGGDQTLYLQITRGADSGRDHGFPAAELPPTCFAMSSPLKAAPERIRQEGARAILVEDLRWQRCDIKSTALLPNVLAKQAARDAGADEALFHRDGELLEGSSMTLFLVREGRLHTPPKSRAILPGITRDAVIRLAERLKIEVRQAPIARSELENADELWLTSSSRDIMPVTQVDDIRIGAGHPGPLWQRFHAAFLDWAREAEIAS